jgi:hypothetical protein
MSEPIGNRRAFERLPGGGYRLTLIDDAVCVEVRHLRRERHQLIGEMNVRCEWAGASVYNGSLSCADMNLSSQSAREGRGKYCAARAHSRPQDFDWPGVIDEACRRVIDAERNSGDWIVLDDAPTEGPPQDFLVHGLAIPADSHSQLVSDGGGLKSLIELTVLGEIAKRGTPVALLDWEWNAARHKARKDRLFGPTRLDALHYLHVRNSLAVEHDHVRQFCQDREIQFIGIDSIGAACDGKLADDDVARAYNHALDDLPPSLAAAHVPKNGNDPSGDLKAFGSAFFHNYARMTWTVRKQIGASDDLVTVMLVPHKQNDGARLPPVGLEFSFSPTRIDVRPVNPVAVDGLAETLPLAVRMQHFLKGGPQTIAVIADELGAKQDSVIKASKRSGTFVKLINTPDGVHRIALVERRFS